VRFGIGARTPPIVVWNTGAAAGGKTAAAADPPGQYAQCAIGRWLPGATGPVEGERLSACAACVLPTTEQISPAPLPGCAAAYAANGASACRRPATIAMERRNRRFIGLNCTQVRRDPVLPICRS